MQLLASAAVPCSLFALGGVLVRYRIGGDLQQAMAASGLKLVAHPMLAWVLAKLVFGLSGAWTWVVVMLAAMAGRVSDLGLTPNRIAALGENVVLLANLCVSAWLYIRFWRGRLPFASLERWQTSYAPVYAVWAAVVVVVFPPIFGFA